MSEEIHKRLVTSDLVLGDYRVSLRGSMIRVTVIERIDEHRTRIVYQWSTGEAYDREYQNDTPWEMELATPRPFTISEAPAFTKENT